MAEPTVGERIAAGIYGTKAGRGVTLAAAIDKAVAEAREEGIKEQDARTANLIARLQPADLSHLAPDRAMSAAIQGFADRLLAAKEAEAGALRDAVSLCLAKISSNGGCTGACCWDDSPRIVAALAPSAGEALLARLRAAEDRVGVLEESTEHLAETGIAWAKRAEAAEEKAEALEVRCAQLGMALNHLTRIEVPESLGDSAWVAETKYCGTQITAYSVRLARRVLAESPADALAALQAARGKEPA